MRLFRYLFFLLAMLSMAILPGQSRALPCADGCQHELHALQAQMQMEHSETVAGQDAEAGVQASGQVDHPEHCVFDHAAGCCVTCASGFVPAGANVQIGLLSRSMTMPVPVADAQREDALLAAMFRPPIVG